MKAELELYEAPLRYEAEVPEPGHRFGEEVERVVHLLSLAIPNPSGFRPVTQKMAVLYDLQKQFMAWCSRLVWSCRCIPPGLCG